MALIGISGRLGSGKDTVGLIVQYLICLDKNTLSEHQKDFAYFQEAPVSNSLQSGWEIKKFAGKLKAVGSLLTGIPIEMFEDQEFKKTDLPNEWVYIENGYAARNMTVRDFLQKLGTEAMRDGLHKEVWVNALFADYKARVKEWDEFGNDTVVEYPNWIITDMRFPNEIAAVELREGITIRVNRSFNHKMGSKETGTIDLTPLHPSETALDDAVFDYTIENDGTLDELVKKVREILTKEKMI